MSKFNLTLPDEQPMLLDLDRLMISEAAKLQKLTGYSPKGWVEALGDDDPMAVKFAVWLAKTRAGGTVSWADLDFDLVGLKWELLDDDGNPVSDDEDEADARPTGSDQEESPDAA